MDCDVIIVGGGPVGLYLAAALGQRGVRVELFEARDGTSRHPAANANSARTMEHFRRIGVSKRIRSLGLPTDYAPDVAYFTSITGHELARLHQPPSGEAERWAQLHAFTWPTPEPPHRCSQLYVEPVLLDAARACSTVKVHFSARVVDFVQGADSVTATVVDTIDGAEAAPRRVRGRYLVGCDGPRSFVRKTLDIRYSGVAGEKREFMGGLMDAVYFYAPDLYRVSPHAPAWQYWTFTPKQRALMIAVDGKGHFIINVQAREGESADAEAIRSRIREAIGAEVPFEIRSTSRWTAGYTLVADRFAAGNALLAGDAAHLFTPTGGLGYNTGIDDAANLAWKIELAMRGEGGERLIDSYDAERRPVALRNTAFARAFADSIGHVSVPANLLDDDAAGAASRDALGDYLQFHASFEFAIPGVHLGTRYESSPLTTPEDGVPPPDNPNLYAPCARAGHRAPHVWIADTSLYDCFGAGFTLLCTGARALTAQDQRTVDAARLTHAALSVVCTDDPQVKALYSANYVLIRPDLHIAWRGDALEEHLQIALDRVLGRNEHAADTAQSIAQRPAA
ncbi:FAD-dependent monooxygenase [Paraburkholderia megapolitana]|uniref:2-polyprenyl-6-methoxyphenol hydroxylase n=1 Tax=Paraburkholderia megapolitana TaxID=420953 RepID=A0A1I3EK21_9BURK|nr:FAD-dependent monooxygenase [Paraburkholderia megapolitana]QDQ80118.1 hypothetical protein FNZ07_02450 [Paraburkholderia megapolitana]SFH99061.1 2-polyprenyl-6-methoxyphenol hydroxylase [Paraburkholderia megapolitana]